MIAFIIRGATLKPNPTHVKKYRLSLTIWNGYSDSWICIWRYAFCRSSKARLTPCSHHSLIFSAHTFAFAWRYPHFGLLYSMIALCNWSSALFLVHFHFMVQAFTLWSKVAQKSGSSIMRATHVSCFLLSCISPVNLIPIPPRACIASILISKSYQMHYQYVNLSTIPFLCTDWNYSDITACLGHAFNCPHLHMSSAPGPTPIHSDYWAGISHINDRWTLHTIHLYADHGQNYIYWMKGGKGSDDALPSDWFAQTVSCYMAWFIKSETIYVALLKSVILFYLSVAFIAPHLGNWDFAHFIMSV